MGDIGKKLRSNYQTCKLPKILQSLKETVNNWTYVDQYTSICGAIRDVYDSFEIIIISKIEYNTKVLTVWF